MTLADLERGGSATVTAIAGCDEISIRLMEMGLIPGVSVQMIAVAPFGDPLEYELRGYRLSLRRREAERVTITC